MESKLSQAQKQLKDIKEEKELSKVSQAKEILALYTVVLHIIGWTREGKEPTVG